MSAAMQQPLWGVDLGGTKIEGTIIDADEDLVELCTRIRQSDNKHCAILFCDEEEVQSRPPSSSKMRRSSYPPTH